MKFILFQEEIQQQKIKQSQQNQATKQETGVNDYPIWNSYLF
jgi:hypothetical protein